MVNGPGVTAAREREATQPDAPERRVAIGGAR